MSQSRIQDSTNVTLFSNATKQRNISFSDVFKQQVTLVNPQLGQCATDVYNLLKKARSEVDNFDPTKVFVYVIMRQNHEFETSPLKAKKHSSLFGLNINYSASENFAFHFFPTYDGIVYDAWLNFEGPLVNYLNDHFIEEKDDKYPIKIYSFNQFIEWTNRKIDAFLEITEKNTLLARLESSMRLESVDSSSSAEREPVKRVSPSCSIL